MTLSADGRVLKVETCRDPDRRAGTEFYAGLLVCDFPADYRRAFDALLARSAEPLTVTLPPLLTPGCGVWVVLSGLDYATLRLTPQSQILRL